MKTALPPIADTETRLLLLGSMPGERSLLAREYYAHPTNAFWWLMGEVLSETDLWSLPYADRTARLKAHHVGLWDVIASARRQGSLDSAIRDATHRDLMDFAGKLPQLKAIGFNGGTASRWGRRHFEGRAACWALIDLPSSSAAHAGMSRAEKLTAWRVVEQFLS
ncbi:DNA-deoxyinosine glycosylase [Rhizorhapis sp. SPR117]|nr:DNA-deoxyinosine glycosylase [Rhizorhapis sp. SPR117]